MTPVKWLLLWLFRIIWKNLHIYEVPKSEIFFSLACAFWDLHTGIARQIIKVSFLDFYVIKNVFFSFKLIQYFAACCLIWIQSGVIHQQPLHHHYHKKVVRADPWFDPILTFKPICHSYHTSPLSQCPQTCHEQAVTRIASPGKKKKGACTHVAPTSASAFWGWNRHRAGDSLAGWSSI